MSKATGKKRTAVEPTVIETVQPAPDAASENIAQPIPRPGELRALFDAYKAAVAALQQAELEVQKATQIRSQAVEQLSRFASAFDTPEGKLIVVKRTTDGVTNYFFRAESNRPTVRID